MPDTHAEICDLEREDGQRSRSRNTEATLAAILNGPSQGPFILKVKWFDPERGYGFVTDGGRDAFLHSSTLIKAGVGDVVSGTVIHCMLVAGPKGPIVQRIERIEPPAEYEHPVQRFEELRGEDPIVQGIVKWFNWDKGFGFVIPDDGGKDIFIHSAVVQRCGLTDLPDGSRVKLTVRQGNKGPEARSIALDDEFETFDEGLDEPPAFFFERKRAGAR